MGGLDARHIRVERSLRTTRPRLRPNRTQRLDEYNYAACGSARRNHPDLHACGGHDGGRHEMGAGLSTVAAGNTIVLIPILLKCTRHNTAFLPVFARAAYAPSAQRTRLMRALVACGGSASSWIGGERSTLFTSVVPGWRDLSGRVGATRRRMSPS